jgi:hypothetical protein
MRNLGKDSWRWLGNLFRVKTAGDLPGWWNTAAWHKAIVVGVSAAMGFTSAHFGATLFLALAVFVLGIPLVSLIGSKISSVQPAPMSLEYTSLRSGIRAFPYPLGKLARSCTAVSDR